jgi:hypothetical protein
LSFLADFHDGDFVEGCGQATEEKAIVPCHLDVDITNNKILFLYNGIEDTLLESDYINTSKGSPNNT